MNALDRLWPYGCWLTTPLPDESAVHPDSAASVAVLGELVAQALPYINTDHWSAKVLVVPADQPLVPVACSGGSLNLRAVLAAGVPIPDGVLPTADSDAELVIVQPEWERRGNRGRIFELWAAAKGPNGWTCKYGSRLTGVRDRISGCPQARPSGSVASDGAYEEHGWSVTAAKIPLSHTIIRADELERGEIRHPIGLLTPRVGGTSAPPVWPAQGSDAASRELLPHGARLRLPASWVVDPKKPHVQQVVETAMRDYGLVHQDTSTVVAFRAEPGTRPYFSEFKQIDKLVRALPWASLERITTGSDTNPTPIV